MVVETIEVQVKGKGIDELIKKLEKLATTCQKVSNTAFKNTSKATKNLTQQLGKLGNAYKKVGNAAGNIATKGTSKVAKGCNTVTKSAQRTSGALGSLLSSLGRIAFYRIIRSIVKAITDALSTGLENVYRFSQIMGTTFANTMDNMSTKAYTMKNQLGAAFASLLSAIMPILLKLISLITQAANAITMLFSAFSGGTYLKAKDTFQSWKDTASAGAAATEEWKNQLMGFDEINKLEDQSSSGSGSGSSTPDYSNMFEEVEIPESVMKAVEWIKDHLEEIKRLVISIGIAFLAWEIMKYVSQLSNVWATLKSILAPLLSIAGMALEIYGIWDMWVNGINWNNLEIAFDGIGLAFVGIYLAFGSTAAAVFVLISGIALLVVGFREWIQTGTASTETLATISVGLLAVGAAIAMLTGSWIPLAVAAVAVAVTWLIGKWEYVKAFFTALGEYLYNVFSGAWDKIAGTVTGNTERIEQGAKKLEVTWSQCWKNATKDIDDASKSADKSASSITDSLTSATSAIQSQGGLDLNIFKTDGTDAFNTLLDSVNTSMPEALSTVTENTGEMADVTEEEMNTMNSSVLSGLTTMNSTANGKLSTLVSTFQSKFSSIASSISSSMSAASSSVWNSISSMQSAINSLNFNVSASVGSYTSKVRKYASGGTPATGSLFVAGERGAELVSSAGGSTSVSNSDQIAESVSVGNEGVVNAVYAMANLIVKSIDSKQTDITLDGMSLARNMYKYNNRVSTEHGKSLVNYG